ncbi:MAG: hypothetical protein VKL42_12535 [Snowella sp.]|nr:hypothetical protein [Snowella sp.]
MNEIFSQMTKVYSNLTYEDFCDRCNFAPSQYALDKFQTLKRGIESITSFDPETLEKLFDAYSWL